MIKVSILLPCYNASEFLSEAIQSILNQTFKDFELLIINDKSVDESEAIIKEFQINDSRVKLIQNELGKGIVGALNTGLKHAKGIYIARADGDDILRVNRLQEQYRFLEQHKDISLLGGGYAPFNKNGHRLDIFHPTSSIELAWRFINDTFFCHPSVMFRKEVIESVGMYGNEKAEDFDFFSRIVRKYKTANLKKILLDYREHDQSLSNVNSIAIKESVERIARRNYEFYFRNLNGFDLLKRFQTSQNISVKELPQLSVINFRLLNKIRKIYKLSIFNTEYIAFNIKLLLQYLKIILNKIKS